MSLIEGSLKQRVILFMMERRLTINEAFAVFGRLEADPKLAYLAGRWNEPAAGFEGHVFDTVTILVRGKVLYWMNKYHEGHRARCMFTGES
jgi:hypothetical protein